MSNSFPLLHQDFQDASSSCLIPTGFTSAGSLHVWTLRRLVSLTPTKPAQADSLSPAYAMTYQLAQSSVQCLYSVVAQSSCLLQDACDLSKDDGSARQEPGICELSAFDKPCNPHTYTTSQFLSILQARPHSPVPPCRCRHQHWNSSACPCRSAQPRGLP